MSGTDGPVIFEREGNVAILTMSHPPHNLLGPTLTDALMGGLDQAREAGCRAIVVRSALRNFSAGAEVGQFSTRGANGGDGAGTSTRGLDFLRAFEELPIPIVASVNGVALGGGFEVALACDFIVAADSARLGLVEGTLGLHPLLGGIQRVIQRAGVARGKEIVMLARRQDPATLEQWGIINRVTPAEKLHEVTMALARELAAGPTVAHGCTKRLANIYLNQGMTAADGAMAEVQGPIWASEDLQIGLRSFAQNGPGMAAFVGR
jgi:enoyl-CoA hydratase/carnithine racemase